MSTSPRHIENGIDEAVDESFPASDPPASTPTTGPVTRPQAPEAGSQAKDPVCGAFVDEVRAAGSSRFGGHTYLFCSDACKQAFDRDPGDYVAPADAQPHPSGIRT